MSNKAVNFYVNSQKVVGTMFYPEISEEKLPAVVFYHGRGSRQERYFKRAEVLCEKGFIVLVFSFRGCGESEGAFSKLTLMDGIDDTLAAFDFLLKQEKVDIEKVGVYGASLGGYLAAIVSSKRKFNWLILDAPAIYKDEWKDIPYLKMPIWEMKKFRKSVRDNNSAISAIKQFKGKLLIIEHGKDEVIPRNVITVYYENAGTKYKQILVIENAPHRVLGKLYNEDTQLIVDWFEEI